MSVFDGLVALAVLGAFGWMIFVRVAEKSPRVKAWLDSLKEKKDDLQNKVPGAEEFSQQIHPGKEALM